MIAMLPCAVILLATPRTIFLCVILSIVLAEYLHRKLRRVLWTRRVILQLRMEDQFIQHSPPRAHILTCARYPDHLWTRSLTLKGLKTMFMDAQTPTARATSKRHTIREHYLRMFNPLRPSRFPVDLAWFSTLGLLWLWFVPEALLQTMSTTTFLCAALLLVVLAIEVSQAILDADLRDGVAHLATLLSEWTLARDYEDVFTTAPEKPYRHTLIYRSPTPAFTALIPAPPLSELETA